MNKHSYDRFSEMLVLTAIWTLFAIILWLMVIVSDPSGGANIGFGFLMLIFIFFSFLIGLLWIFVIVYTVWQKITKK